MATTAKPVAKPKAARYVSPLIDPEASGLDQLTINVHGVPGAGKTWAALSASDYWPAKIPPAAPVTLEDTIHIAWDHGALSGAQAKRIRCAAEHNGNALIGSGKAKDPIHAMGLILGDVGKHCVADEAIKVVIVDTITALDLAVNAHFFAPNNVPIARGTGEVNTQAIYGRILDAHRAFAAALVRLPPRVTVICLFHSQPLVDARDPAQKTAQSLVRLSEAVTVIPSVTGKARDLYLANASVEFACCPTDPPKGSKAEPERRLWTIPHQSGGTTGLRTKNRFQGILGDWEPANLNKILAKIRAAAE